MDDELDNELTLRDGFALIIKLPPTRLQEIAAAAYALADAMLKERN